MLDVEEVPQSLISELIGAEEVPESLKFIVIDAGGFARAESYRNEFPMKDHEPRDHPVVAQLGGSKLLDVVAAAKLASIHSDAVELNVGCPQRCAKKGKYGAFLMEQPVTLIELVEGMVGAVPPHVAVLAPRSGRMRRGSTRDPPHSLCWPHRPREA